MADVPTSVISSLISMDGYEQMLEIDRITVDMVYLKRINEINGQCKGESSEIKIDPISDPSFARSKSVDYDMEPTRRATDRPEALKMHIVFVWNMILLSQVVHVNHK